MVVNSSACPTARLDYLPYGASLLGSSGWRQSITDTCNPTAQQHTYQQDGGVREKFTGKERDSESGLDYFGARYFSGAQGRFATPDSTAYSSLRHPQSWNLYAYTLNNPLKFIDPHGNAVELTRCNSVEACQTTLDEIVKAVGNSKAKDLLFVNTYNGKFFVGIKGNVAAFAKLSENAAKLERMVSDGTRVVQAFLGSKYDDTDGAERTVAGGFSGTPSEGYKQPFSVIDPHPSKAYDQGDLWGYRKDGTFGAIPRASPGEVMAHELLGHQYAELYLGYKAGTLPNLREAVIAEDEVRRTDPTRGLKTQHGQTGTVLTPSDLERLKRK